MGFRVAVGASIGSVLVANCNIESDIGVAFNAGAWVPSGKITGKVVERNNAHSDAPGAVT